MDEVFKPIQGVQYEVSNYGAVRHLITNEPINAHKYAMKKGSKPKWYVALKVNGVKSIANKSGIIHVYVSSSSRMLLFFY